MAILKMVHAKIHPISPVCPQSSIALVAELYRHTPFISFLVKIMVSFKGWVNLRKGLLRLHANLYGPGPLVNLFCPHDFKESFNFIPYLLFLIHLVEVVQESSDFILCLQEFVLSSWIKQMRKVHNARKYDISLQ